MTLQDAVDKQFYEEPKKRIIREPNNRGWCDVWFEFDIKIRKLCVWGYNASHGSRKGVAAFQDSQHEDWILI